MSGRAAAVVVAIGLASQMGVHAFEPQLPAKPDPAGFPLRSPLVLGKGAKPVVSLGRPVELFDSREKEAGILARELVRQALLIAARDELDLATRDEVLDELPPGKGDRAELATSFLSGQACKVVILRAGEADGKNLLAGSPNLKARSTEFLRDLCVEAEKLSRAGFPEALRSLGARGAGHKARKDAALPARVEERLGSLDFVEIFAAVRDLHAAIKADGESAARVGALARAYALLGVLSDYQWHPAADAFKARAWLYAQRIVAREPASPLALRHRAFVEVLIGRPDYALADLGQVRDGGASPAWVKRIEAYAKGDMAALRVKGTDEPLAALLRMMATEEPVESMAALRSAREVVELAPDCYRAFDTMCRAGGVSNLHVVTELGPQTLTEHLPAKLRGIAGLPAAVRAMLDRKAGELAVVDALARAQDSGEPSWATLAHLIREARFVQVYHRLHFMRIVWSVPVEDYWADVRPFVAGHRYLPYLETLALPPQGAFRAFAAFVAGMDFSDVEFTIDPVISAIAQVQSPRLSEVLNVVASHVDPCVRDLSQRIQHTIVKVKPLFAAQLLAIAPHSTFAMATLVQFDWEGSKDKVAAWEREAGDSPVLLGGLSQHYLGAKDFAKAEPYLARYIRQSPDQWAYLALASAYKARGDLDRWKATLDELLAKDEDRGLERTKAQVEIANGFMEREKWAEALPYAEAAAESQAAWAMMTAARCAEGLKDWEKADRWTRQTSERYPSNQWMRWYLFCKRTGHGDEEAARAWTAEYLTAVEGRPDLADPSMAGYFYWLSGNLKKAQEIFDGTYQRDHRVATGIDLALIADEQGQIERRDSMLSKAFASCSDETERAIYGEFRNALSHPDKPVDVALIDKCVAHYVPGAEANLNFRVGMFLLKHGKPEDGRAHLKLCADGPGYEWMNVLAIDVLRRLDAKKTP